MRGAGLTRAVIEPRNPILNVSRGRNLPRSPAVRIGELIFVSGMSSLDPNTGERNHGPIADQVRQVLANMAHLLESGGSGLDRVVKLHIVLADMARRDEALAVLRATFPSVPPACTVTGMQLGNGNGVEIECVAVA
jgi:2-iminobutanoate/2-iminopropanoate deaminase